MNKSPRPMRYRRSVYRRRKIKIIITTALCVLAICLVLFVIFGNILAKKVALRLEGSSSKGNDTATLEDHASVKDVNAVSIALSSSGSTLDGRVAAAVKNGYTDVCFDIDDDDGALTYASSTASAYSADSKLLPKISRSSSTALSLTMILAA